MRKRLRQPASQAQLIVMALAIAAIVGIGGLAVRGINETAIQRADAVQLRALERVNAYQIDVCKSSLPRFAYQRYDGLDDRDTPYAVAEALHQLRNCKASIDAGRSIYLPDAVQDECVRLIGEGRRCTVEGMELTGSKPIRR